MSTVGPLPINPPPGVVVTETDRVAEGRWIPPFDKIRFVKQKPQKIGGNIRVTSEAMSGTPRATLCWRDFLQNQYVANGTYRKLYAFDSSFALNDITPFSSTGSLGLDPFTTTSGSASVIVAHTGHGRNVGDTAIFSGASAVNGIDMNGAFIVATVIDANDYTVTGANVALPDGNDTYTKSLLHFDGIDGTTVFTDSNAGGSAHAWTAGGAAQLDTSTVKFGTASGQFTGANDYITTPDSADFTIGTGDLTIDLWFNCAAAGGTQVELAGQCDNLASAASTSWRIERSAANVMICWVFVGATPFTCTGTTPFSSVLNTGWHHLALVISAHTLKMFIDGTQEGASTPIVGSVNDSSNNVSIGRLGEYPVATWTGWVDEFRFSRGVARWTANFTPPTNAYGATGGGGSVTYEYEIPVGTELGAYGQGWGVGPWGLGTWGTARGSSTIFIEPRVWSLDKFGVVLLATYNGGSLWSFDPTQAQPWPRAVSTFGGVPMNAPTDFRAMFVTPERFVFGLCDQMVVKVCSQNDPTDWVPSTSNTAFQRTMQEGGKLVGGKVLAPFISLVWTDAALYLFQYTGSQFVYNSSLAGKDCGLISPNGAITVDGVAYWMGPDNFYQYNGSVSPMLNVEDIRKYVFDAVPVSLAFQCAAIYVPKYHEIWWFYPTTGATNPTNYVIYHINDGIWSIGTADFYSSVGMTAGRASGSHFTAGDTSPLMAGTDGYLYNHDPIGDAYNDNGNPLVWTLNLSPYALNEGLQNIDVEGILFDFFQQSGNVDATVNTYDRLTDLAPMDTQTQVVPDIQAGLTDYRVSGRYIGLTMTSDDLGNYMRLGKPVAFGRPTARRR